MFAEDPAAIGVASMTGAGNELTNVEVIMLPLVPEYVAEGEVVVIVAESAPTVP